MGTHQSKHALALALVGVVLSFGGCASLDVATDDPCVTATVLKSWVGIVSPNAITLGPSSQTILAIGEACEGRAAVINGTIEVEIPQ